LQRESNVSEKKDVINSEAAKAVIISWVGGGGASHRGVTEGRRGRGRGGEKKWNLAALRMVAEKSSGWKGAAVRGIERRMMNRKRTRGRKVEVEARL